MIQESIHHFWNGMDIVFAHHINNGLENMQTKNLTILQNTQMAAH